MKVRFIIYIPLWFYSNLAFDEWGRNKDKFTFHYGSILIGINVVKMYQETIFTFHYGSILIHSLILLAQLQQNLHSTMVLF